MVDNINNYTFDFVTEAEDLRRSLGPPADNFLLVSVDVIAPPLEDINTPYKTSLRHVVGESEFIRCDLPAVREWVDFHYNKEPDEASIVITIPTAQEKYAYVVSIRENHHSVEELGDKNKDALKLFLLYHETCHALLPDGPEVDSNHPLREATADAYAALRFFQRFGQDAEALVSMISWRRALGVLIEGDTAHLSTTVLDKIIADSAERDFSKLTPAETLELAETYAKKWTPTASALSAARKTFVKAGKDADVLDILDTICLSPSTNKLAFYIAAKASQTLQHPKGLACAGETLRFTVKKRQRYAASVKNRDSKTYLSGVFRNAAKESKTEPSLAELLKVSLPDGQKQFVFRM